MPDDIVSARYVNEDRSTIAVILDNGKELFVPVDDGNSRYLQLLDYIAENPAFVISNFQQIDTAASVPKVELVRAMRKTRLNGGPITAPATQTSIWQAAKQALPTAPADLKEDWDLLGDVPRDDDVVQYIVDTIPWAGTYSGDEIMDEVYRIALEAAK